MSSTPDYYALLGVSRSGSEEDIHLAFRALTKRLHPDVNKNIGAATQFREINAAHDLLSNFSERQRYNASYRPDTANLLNVRVTSSQRTLPLLDELQVLYMLVDITADPAQAVGTSEARLNLTLVLDLSKSMKEHRLERLKAATSSIIDQLDKDDILSIVTFSDEAEVLLRAEPLRDKPGAKGKIALMQPIGGTEMFKGLSKGFAENQRFASKKYVNHMILVTDGRTWQDEPQCLDLAERAHKEGIGISAMGMGDEWNDTFLDQLASRTGGTSEYINTSGAVVRFMNERVRSLGQSYAERLTLSVAPDPDIRLELAYRLHPTAQPVMLDQDPIPLGSLQVRGSVSVLLQFQLNAQTRPGIRPVARLDVTGDVLREQRIGYKVIADMSVDVAEGVEPAETPLLLMDALSKFSLYRLQQRAEQAVNAGESAQATKHLETLATRFLQAGHTELASKASEEAQRVRQTSHFSAEGQKALKFGTRTLGSQEARSQTVKPLALPPPSSATPSTGISAANRRDPPKGLP